MEAKFVYFYKLLNHTMKKQSEFEEEKSLHIKEPENYWNEKPKKQPENHSPKESSNVKVSDFGIPEDTPSGNPCKKEAEGTFNLSNYIGYFDDKNIDKKLLVEKVKEFIRLLTDIPLTAEQLAKEFHNTYENFAENNGWKTQKDCRVKFDDLPDKNKETMIDTCQHILLWIEAIMKNKRDKLAGEHLR